MDDDGASDDAHDDTYDDGSDFSAKLKPIVDKIAEYKKEKNEIINLTELIKDSDQEISKIAEIELLEKKNL